MATLAPQRISVTLPGDMAGFLSRRAERDKTSVPKTLVSLVAGIMENEEDEISDEEDRRLSRLVEEREATATGFISHEEMWKRINAL
jgi:hypothetical protein